MGDFFNELKNRNVYKAATAYVVTGWLIMQVVDTMGNNLEWSPAIASWITKILIVGFPITLVITWLYEVTPGGLKRTGTIQKDTPENRRSGKRLNHLIIVVLAVAICFMLVERVFFAGNTSINPRQEASIAVLPFVNMSSEEENEYFADGLTEQILDELANLRGLQVPARTSSFKFKDKNEDIREIAKILGVNYILEGSVQFDSRRNRIKITTQLINAGNGYHLSSETYEDDFDEIFAIQEDVARKVASQLRVRLLQEEEMVLAEKLTQNPEAYKLYLKSRQFSMKRTDSDLKQAIELLNKAVELDPMFAEAHAELSFLYGQLHFYGNLSEKERDEMMKHHMDLAMDIAPEKPEVLWAKARFYDKDPKDSSQVIADLRKAIELKPNYADAYSSLSQVLTGAKQYKLSIAAREKALELDPLNEFFAGMLTAAYYYSEQYEKAFALLDKRIKNNSGGHGQKALYISQEPYGDLVQGFKLLHAAAKEDPYGIFSLAWPMEFSLNIDLWPLAERNCRILQNRYPENPWATYGNSQGLYAFKREFTKWEEWIDLWATAKGLEKEREAMDRAGLNALRGNYAKARSIFLQAFPEFDRNQINIDSLNIRTSDDWIFYIDLLRLNQDNHTADTLAGVICQYYKGLIENGDFPKGNDINEYDGLMDCYYISDDIENFTKILEERFFVKKDRLRVFSNMKRGVYQRFEALPEYQKLFKRIEAETHRQRAEVIAYLKEEGDWDPAWDKELGLD